MESRLRRRIVAALGLVMAAPGCADGPRIQESGGGGTMGSAQTSSDGGESGDPGSEGDGDGVVDEGEVDDGVECGAPVEKVVCVPLDRENDDGVGTSVGSDGTSSDDGGGSESGGSSGSTSSGSGDAGDESSGGSAACTEDIYINPDFCAYDIGPIFEMDGQCCREMGGYQECCDGRPFIVEHEARTARAVSRGDWCGSERVERGGLEPELAAALATAWEADGLMEHASIASFSRFILHLVGLGAPPELVRDAQQAIADEVEHARTCFAFASAYAGRSIGPGPLDVDDAMRDPVTLVSAAVAAVREGCIGETLAAYQAEVASSRARQPTVAAALQRIAEDEARHAALAWRFVAWAIQRGGERVRTAVAEAFAAPVSFIDPDQPRFDLDRERWRDHGRLTPAELSTVLERGHQEVVLPCALALLDAPNATATHVLA